MSSATRFAAVVSLVGLIVAARPARDVGSVGAASLTFFTDRAAFQARASNLTLEDFERGSVPPNGVMSCPAPLDWNTNNTCFASNSIRPGVQFNSSTPRSGFELALIGQGFMGAPSKNLVANFYGDGFVMSFPGGNVGAVGGDLIAYFQNDTCSIEIAGANGVLGSTTAPCTDPGTFWGVIADAPITRITVTPSSGNVGGLDNLAFGAGAPTAIQVVLAIKPGSGVSAALNPWSQGVTPAAVLSTADFDASQIDVGSLAFGPGKAPVAAGAQLVDVNGDGRPDLLLRFSTPAARLACGDTQVTMTGRTLTGRQITGTGAVQTVGCTKS